LRARRPPHETRLADAAAAYRRKPAHKSIAQRRRIRGFREAFATGFA
jgi:hypothetical protein